MTGDPYSKIDWKATAKRGQPICRETFAERRQTLLLLLDCGRRMAGETNGQSRLDRAIEAALLLSHIALRSDDQVGLVAFADRVLSVVPPVRSYSGVETLAQAMFSLQPVLREPPYTTISAEIANRFRKRTLLVLFTDLLEPESYSTLVKPLHFLSQRHLVLCTLFHDRAAQSALNAALTTEQDLYRAGVAADLALERASGLSKLHLAGILTLETAPEQLSHPSGQPIPRDSKLGICCNWLYFAIIELIKSFAESATDPQLKMMVAQMPPGMPPHGP